MSTKKLVIDLYYDIVSPYSWVGFEALTRYRTKWDFALSLKPVFLGGIMKGAGNQPPMMVSRKGLYMMTDLHRNAEYFSVPLRPLADPVDAILTQGSLPTMRFLTGLRLHNPALVEAASRAFWHRRYSQDLSIIKPEDMMEVSRIIKLPSDEAESLIAGLGDAKVKDALKALTQEALDLDAFGLPWIVVHKDGQKHSFFGSDRFHLIAHLLGKPFPGPCLESATSSKL